MICYAVIDTNVLVSAMLSSKEDAATVQVVSRMLRGEIIPIYSNAITEEYRNVLCRRKFGFEEKLIADSRFLRGVADDARAVLTVCRPHEACPV